MGVCCYWWFLGVGNVGGDLGCVGGCFGGLVGWIIDVNWFFGLWLGVVVECCCGG